MRVCRRCWLRQAVQDGLVLESRDRGFVRAEGDPDNQEHDSQGLAAQSAQADLLKV